MPGPFVAPTNGDVLRVVIVPLVSVAASAQMSSSGGWLLGWMIAEDTGAAPATVRIFDGNSAGGMLIAKIPLLAGALSSVRPSTVGWPVDIGLWLQVDAGAVSGSFAMGYAS